MDLRRLLGEIEYQAKGRIDVPSWLKRELLSIAQQKINEYTPQVSEILGIDLSPPQARDYRDLVKDKVCRERLDWKENLGRIPNKLDNFFINLDEVMNDPLSLLITIARDKIINETRVCYLPITSNIYFPLDIPKVELLFERNHLDHVILHELGHHVWYNTPGHNGPYRGICKKWQEGFSEFLMANWLSDLIPEDHPNTKSSEKPYCEGYDRVCYIGIFHGCEKILKIPREWKKFERLYQCRERGDADIIELDIALEKAVREKTA